MHARFVVVSVLSTWMAICGGRSAAIVAMHPSKSQRKQATAIEPSVTGNKVTFEVASVKSNKSGQLAMNLGRPFKGGTYTATNVALRNVIALAYGIPVERLLGGPSWIGAASTDVRFIGGDRFDISAALPQGSSADQVPAMLRALLADRFKMVVHNEVREAPVYALILARDDKRPGPQLH